MAGSIGVYGSHEDHSQELEKQGIKVTLISAGKYKTEGSPLGELSADARADLQSKVDDFYGMFVRSVAQSRNDTQQNVRQGYGQGRMMIGAKAVKANLADRVETLDDVLSRLGVGGLPRSGRGAGRSQESAALMDRHRRLALDMMALNASGLISADPSPDVPDNDTDDTDDERVSKLKRKQMELDLIRMGGPPDSQRSMRACRQLDRRRRDLGLL
jgi:ClpP class serine protease